MSRLRPLFAILVFLVAVPLLAGNDCGDISIASLSANDVQLNQPVTIAWSYGGAAPVSQTMSISSVGSSVLSSVDDRTYVHQATRPGAYQVRLSASSECGTAEATTQFFVRNCYVAVPVVQVSDDVVNPGDVVNASVEVPADHTAEWFAVSGGTLLSADGGTATFTAGSEGPLQIEVVLTNDKGCTEKGSASVAICNLATPVVAVSPASVSPNGLVNASVDVPADYSVRWFAVSGGTLLGGNGPTALFRAGSEGPLRIDAIVTDPAGCSATGSASVEIVLPPPPPTYCHPYVASLGELYYGACPDQPKAEYLTQPVPAGATVEWSVSKGEILSGQGTGRITYVVHATAGETYSITNQLVFPDGCKSYPYSKTVPVLGAPTTSISLSSPSIHAGESTTIYLTNSYVSGFNFYAENGDSIEPIYQNTPIPCCTNMVHPYKYTSTHGAGISTIRSYVVGTCGGTAEASTTLEILP